MGFEDFPVLMVSWWGAKHYCRWLTKHTNDRLEQKGEWRELNYRLPEEYEWISAASDSNLISDSAVMCDSIGLYVNKTRLMGIRNIRSCGKNNCGREGRLKDGFYSDTGFRIVQTYLGKATGAEF